MKQKILFQSFIISIMLLFAISSQAYAKVVEVKSLTTFSTDKPPSTISIQTMEPVYLNKNLQVGPGTEISGYLVDVKSPKRLKRNAKFSFLPNSYIGQDGLSYKVDNPAKAKLSKPIDKKQVTKKAALGIGNFFVKGLSIGVAAVKGAVENEEENRLKSSAISAYEASPISYVEKGKDLEINEADIFYLKFPNYEDKNNVNKE